MEEKNFNHDFEFSSLKSIDPMGGKQSAQNFIKQKSFDKTTYANLASSKYVLNFYLNKLGYTSN